MRVAFLTWGETPRLAGVLGSQVVRPYADLGANPAVSHFSLICGLPALHSGLFRERHRYVKELSNIRSIMRGNLSIVPIPVVQTKIYSTSLKEFQRFHASISHKLLARSFCDAEPDIVHCRSYHATWAALAVRRKYSMSYKVVFDARGNFPEEVAFKSPRGFDDCTYDMWKRLEQQMLDESDVVLGVSGVLTDHFASMTETRCMTSYPACALAPNASNRPIGGEDMLRLVYVGALAADTWHSPAELGRLYRRIRSLAKTRTRLFVISSSAEKQYARSLGLERSEWESIEAPDSAAVMAQLQNCDIGLLPFRPTRSKYEATIGRTMLGTKTVEYAGSGIPTIASSAAGGAAEIISSRGLGISYDNIDDLTAKELDAVLRLRRSDIIDSAVDLFSPASWQARQLEIWRIALAADSC